MGISPLCSFKFLQHFKIITGTSHSGTLWIWQCRALPVAMGKEFALVCVCVIFLWKAASQIQAQLSCTSAAGIPAWRESCTGAEVPANSPPSSRLQCFVWLWRGSALSPGIFGPGWAEQGRAGQMFRAAVLGELWGWSMDQPGGVSPGIFDQAKPLADRLGRNAELSLTMQN